MLVKYWKLKALCERIQDNNNVKLANQTAWLAKVDIYQGGKNKSRIEQQRETTILREARRRSYCDRKQKPGQDHPTNKRNRM